MSDDDDPFDALVEKGATSLDEYRKLSQDRDWNLDPATARKLLDEAIDRIEALEAHITVLRKGELVGGRIERKHDRERKD